MSRLTHADVVKIRRLSKDGVTAKYIKRRLQLSASPSAIANAAAGRTYGKRNAHPCRSGRGPDVR